MARQRARVPAAQTFDLNNGELLVPARCKHRAGRCVPARVCARDASSTARLTCIMQHGVPKLNCSDHPWLQIRAKLDDNSMTFRVEIREEEGQAAGRVGVLFDRERAQGLLQQQLRGVRRDAQPCAPPMQSGHLARHAARSGEAAGGALASVWRAEALCLGGRGRAHRSGV